jgi:hypothetical protein
MQEQTKDADTSMMHARLQKQAVELLELNAHLTSDYYSSILRAWLKQLSWQQCFLRTLA